MDLTALDVLVAVVDRGVAEDVLVVLIGEVGRGREAVTEFPSEAD